MQLKKTNRVVDALLWGALYLVAAAFLGVVFYLLWKLDWDSDSAPRGGAEQLIAEVVCALISLVVVATRKRRL